MKVFVYSKKTSAKIATITSVCNVEFVRGSDIIIFTTFSGEKFSFNTKEVKTTTYQN